VLFHAINGLRITILDLWPRLLPHQREAVWVEWAVFLPLYGFAVYVILKTGLGV
jgi:succinate dehydrogenase/fumarate reductase cytochrome b subunit